MKQIIITIAILFTMVMVSFQADARQVVISTENYTISTDATINYSSNNEKSWIVAYGEKQIMVFKHETKKGDEYIVRNNFFEVRYVNTQSGFGVKQIKSKQAKVASEITNVVINPAQMEQQAILSPDKLDEEKALNYIASFVPFLLNDNYSHLLN